jgi:hypothetical protein
VSRAAPWTAICPSSLFRLYARNGIRFELAGDLIHSWGA